MNNHRHKDILFTTKSIPLCRSQDLTLLADQQNADTASTGSSFFSALANMFLPPASGPSNDARSARRGKLKKHPPNSANTRHPPPQPSLRSQSTNSLLSSLTTNTGGRLSQSPHQLISAFAGTGTSDRGGGFKGGGWAQNVGSNWVQKVKDPHRMGKRQQGFLPSFVGSLVATATPQTSEAPTTRHVTAGLSVAAISPKISPKNKNNNAQVITGGGTAPSPPSEVTLTPAAATPRTFRLPFMSKTRYPDPYLTTIAPLTAAPLPIKHTLTTPHRTPQPVALKHSPPPPPPPNRTPKTPPFPSSNLNHNHIRWAY